MTKKRKKQSLLLASRNSEDKNLKKTIEELTELSLELIQRMNKPHKNNDAAVISEIAHVKIRLWYLEKRYGKSNINKEIDEKLKTLNNVNIRRRGYKKSIS